mmetsp:Transcript_74285/g.187159  ORF Transcript_74285/g.187159 Transcript_74285/m.187159 type:complete len:234 (-) Transcript_74285:557-1258(-)
MLLPVVRASDFLLQLGSLQEPVRLHEPGELMHDSHVLRHVARQLAELGVLVDELLHLLDRLYLCGVLRLLLVVLHVLLDVDAQVAEVRQDVLLEKRVLSCGHHDHLQLRPDVRHLGHVDPVVVHREELVQHRLVRPLVQQRRHRIVPPVQQKQHRGGLALFLPVHLLEKGLLLLYAQLQLLRHLSSQRRRRGVADRGQHAERQTDRQQPLQCSVEDALLVGRPSAAVLCQPRC